MPVNPFQTVAEMSWGDYKTKKSGYVQSPQAQSSLAGQGHRSKGWAPGAPEATLEAPRAGGKMPMGNANIGRPDYGSQQPQQRQSRRASFGGMGAGATKGGGSGMTAGGDIKFDLSIGKTDYRGADMQGARIGASGMGAKTSDSNLGDIDQSQGYTPTTTGPKAGSSRGGAGAAGKGGSGGAKAGAGSGPGGAGGAGRGGAGGNSARGGDTGDMTTSMDGQKMGSPVLNIGRNRIDSDNISRRSNTRTTKTDVSASGSATASADTKTDARKTVPTKTKKEKTTAEPTNASAPKEDPKEDPKAESVGKETVKTKAKKAVSKATKTPPVALTKNTKKKGAKK